MNNADEGIAGKGIRLIPQSTFTPPEHVAGPPSAVINAFLSHGVVELVYSISITITLAALLIVFHTLLGVCKKQMRRVAEMVEAKVTEPVDETVSPVACTLQTLAGRYKVRSMVTPAAPSSKEQFEKGVLTEEEREEVE